MMVHCLVMCIVSSNYFHLLKSYAVDKEMFFFYGQTDFVAGA